MSISDILVSNIFNFEQLSSNFLFLPLIIQPLELYYQKDLQYILLEIKGY